MRMEIILLVMIRKYFQWHRALVFHVPAKFPKILKNKFTNVRERFFFNNIINSIQNHILALVVLNKKFVSRKAAQLYVQHLTYKANVKGNDK